MRSRALPPAAYLKHLEEAGVDARPDQAKRRRQRSKANYLRLVRE